MKANGRYLGLEFAFAVDFFDHKPLSDLPSFTMNAFAVKFFDLKMPTHSCDKPCNCPNPFFLLCPKIAFPGKRHYHLPCK